MNAYEAFLISSQGVKTAASTGVAVAGNNTVALSAETLNRLQSGKYKALIALYTGVGEEKRFLVYSESAAEMQNYDEYINAATPAAPVVESISYVGEGDYLIELVAADPAYGYELRIAGVLYGVDETEILSDMLLDFAAGDPLVFGYGLKAGEAYEVFVRAYAVSTGSDGNIYKLYGAESAEETFTVISLPLAEVTESSDDFAKNPADGVYYIKANTDTDSLAEIRFVSADCESFTLTVTEDGNAVPLQTATGNALDLIVEIDTGCAARYSITVTTVTAEGDVGRYVFKLVVDGGAPVFIVDAESAVFDGTNLSFDAYLEQGATIVPDGTWVYNVADAAVRAETGDYSGRWSGAVTAVARDVASADNDAGAEAMETFATVYDIILTAKSFSGNEAQVQLSLMRVVGDTDDGEQLLLDTSVGTLLSLGMTGIALTASAVTAPLYQESVVNVGDLTDLATSDADVITVDALGNITVTGVGRAYISGKYGALEARISLTVIDALPLGIVIEEIADNSVRILFPALPGNTSIFTVSTGGSTFDIANGFEAPQSLLFDGLIQDTTISFTDNGGVYRQANISFSVPVPVLPCDCDVCPTCGGCLEDVCCTAPDCQCNGMCPGHEPDPVCDCNVCPECGGCLEGVCCTAPDCQCNGICPGHEPDPVCDCNVCPECGGCLEGVCCNAPDCQCVGMCPGHEPVPACDCNVCPECGGCLEGVCCPAPDCQCNGICPGHEPVPVCDCNVCPECGGCLEGVCCNAPDCQCVGMCPGHEPVPVCDCNVCPECGGCLEDACCNAPDCQCDGVCEGHEPVPAYDCNVCPTCGGCLEDACCTAPDCQCVGMCPGHEPVPACDCSVCPECGGCLEDACCNAPDCQCNGMCPGHEPVPACDCSVCLECGGCLEDACCTAPDCQCDGVCPGHKVPDPDDDGCKSIMAADIGGFLCILFAFATAASIKKRRYTF